MKGRPTFGAGDDGARCKSNLMKFLNNYEESKVDLDKYKGAVKNISGREPKNNEIT